MRLREAIPNIMTHGQTNFVLLYTVNGFLISCCYTYFLDSSIEKRRPRVSSTLCPAVHILGPQNVYSRAEGIADHYWPWAVFFLNPLLLPNTYISPLLSSLFSYPPTLIPLPFFQSPVAQSPAHLAPSPSRLAINPTQLALSPSYLALSPSQLAPSPS